MLYKIYTSYYANIKNIPKEFKLVSISRITPKWLGNVKSHGRVLVDKALSPRFHILNKYKLDGDEQAYIKSFNLQMKEIDWVAKANQFNTLDGTVVLLCYERPGEFCHRHLIAREFEKNFKFNIEELK